MNSEDTPENTQTDEITTKNTQIDDNMVKPTDQETIKEGRSILVPNINNLTADIQLTGLKKPCWTLTHL